MPKEPPLAVDIQSLLVEVSGTRTLDALETDLAARGFTLGIAMSELDPAMSVDTWLARGAPGAPSALADPTDHLVAGLEATLVGGKRLEIRPGPRRAVGPDLTALLVGAAGRFGRIERAWLRIHPQGAERPALPLPDVDLDPPVTESEAACLDAMAAALRRE